MKLKRIIFMLFSAWALLTFQTMYVFSQQTITGTVTDADGPVSGATIQIKGGSLSATTDADGKFSINASVNDVLVISFIGYEPKEVAISPDITHYSIDLSSDIEEVGEVVVTALGIRKEKKALGYSVTEVKGESLTQARETNVMNSLTGKVAGLNISGGTGGPGASTNVLIRGVSSIGGTTQPLYVVNGVPMENPRQSQPGGQWDNAPDLGDAIGNINPDDIESISVLKGAAASALYGYRAKAGVIMITTKSGGSSGIEFNSNFVGEQIMDLTDWQYVYGQGANNAKPVSGTAAAQVGGSSWGGLLDGSMVPQFDGVERPYVAVKDNLSKFYRSGSNWTNTITLNKDFTGGSVRVSASNMDNKSVVPHSSLTRNTFNIAGVFEPIKNLKIDTRGNYILESADNRAMLSDGAGNANYQVMFLPTSLDVNTLKPGVNADGTELVYNSNNLYATNPWFAAEQFENDTKRERLITSVTARYDFESGYYIQGRAARDNFSDSYFNVVPTGTAYRPNGSMSSRITEFTDINADFLVGKAFEFGDFGLNPVFGGAYRNTRTLNTTNSGSDFNVPFVYNILNTANKSVAYSDSQLEVQSLYGNVEFSYKDYLYLTGSLRSDWFSTLATPGLDNKLNILYPSINGSFVFSELWKPTFLSFGKVRLGYAEVGAATDPYQTLLSYNFLSETIGNYPLGTISNGSIPNSNLLASRARELEIGTELHFFNNRLTVDATWYNKVSNDEIIPVSISSSTGYTGAVLNSGSLRNRGFEGLVTAHVLQNPEGFSWTTSLNGSINNNEVLRMAEGTTIMPMGTSRTGYGFVQHMLNMPSFQIMAYDYKYDEAGEIVYLPSGVPDRGELIPMGSSIPKWTAGWNNEFKLQAGEFIIFDRRQMGREDLFRK